MLETTGGAPPSRVNRALALAFAVVLVGGPIAGYAAGRASVDEPEQVAAAGADDASSTDAVDAAASDGSDGFRRVLVRDIGDIRVRVYDSRYAPMEDGNPFWEAPAWCSSLGSLTVELSTPELATMETIDYTATEDGPSTSHATLTGVAEGSPVWLAVVRDEAATSVSVRFPDGSTDSMAPVGGVAVLATRAPATTEHPDVGPRFDATVVSPSGTRAVTLRPYWDQLEGGYPGDDPACHPPPPELPPPGEQPADAGAARDAVEAAYDGLYGAVRASGEGRVHLEDPEAMADEFARIEEQGLPVPDDSAVLIEVKELVFDRPDHAWLRYDLVVQDLSTFSDRIGEAVLVDGAWKVANATLCQDLALGGITCD